MTEAHIGSVLPIKNRVLGVDEDTVFLAHYDLNQHDVLRGVKAMGATSASLWGATKFISTGPQYWIETNLTLAAWIYPTETPVGDRGCILIGKGVGGYYLTLDNTLKLAAYWHGKTPAGYHQSTASCPLNTWTHVALVWSATELKMYINGNLDKTIAVTGAGNRVDYVEMGIEGGASRPFVGRVRELGVFADAKSEAQIQELMNKGMGEEMRGVRSFWRMNEGEGTILRDSSPFHADVVLEPNRSLSWAPGNSVFTLRPEEGRFGGAIAIEEATTNEIASPDWSSYGSYGGYDMRQIDEPLSVIGKGFHMKCVSDTANSSGRVTPSRLASADSGNHTFSVFAKGGPTSIGKNIRIFTGVNWHNYAGTERLTGEYQLFVFPNLPYGTSSGGFGIALSGWALNDDLYMHTPMLESKPFATSFVDGVRSGGNLVYPQQILNVSEGTISFWAYIDPDGPHSSTVGWAMAFTIAEVVSSPSYNELNQLGVRKYPSSTEWRAYSSSGTGNSSSASIGSPQKGWNMISMTWGNNTLKAYLNGQLITTNANANLPANFDNPSGGGLLIGRWTSGNYLNSMIDELRIDRIARTDEEIAAWYESNSPFWPRGIYRKE